MLKIRKYIGLMLLSLGGVLALGMGGVLASGVVGLRLSRYRPELSTVISDRDGAVLQYVFEDEHRLWADLDEISPWIKQATVAMEDHRFYEHPGLDVRAIGRAINSTVFEGELQGGSTLTQQYVKNAFLSPERTLVRKAKEAYLAVVLETMYDKDRILEKYLNEVSYGGIYYGVEAAANYYFDKSAKEVTLAEAAVLASLTKAPSDLRPGENDVELLQRQKLVLERMQAQGVISEAEKNKAVAEEIRWVRKPLPFKAPHWVNLVKQELIGEYGKEKVEAGGLRVVTTLDSEIQDFAQEAVRQELASLRGANVTNGAVLVMEPETGEVLAWVGSKDFLDESIGGQYDVLQAYRQPGSTLKPLLYSLALKSGYTAATVINDVKTTFETGGRTYTPVNYDSRYHGPVTMRQALANSYNVPAARMGVALGVKTFIDYLHDLGMEYVDPARAGVALALGGYEIRPLDLARAYTALANEGELEEPKYIMEVDDSKGKQLDWKEARAERVMSEEVAYIISDILADNQARAPVFGSNSLLNVPDVKVAAKTGTSNEKRDNWTVGYTPEFLVLTWVGNNDNSPMYAVASGLTGATPIWRAMVEELIAIYGASWYNKPSGVVQMAASEWGCGEIRGGQELFVRGTQPDDCQALALAKDGEREEWEKAEGGEDDKREEEIKPTQGAILYEERDGEQVAVKELTSEEVRQFKENPFSIIEDNKDQLQADDKPTKIFIEQQSVRVRRVRDPLSRMSEEGERVDLDLLE